MADFLTPDELHGLTDLRQKSAQIAWLRARRWRFEVSAQGFPKVARAYWQLRMVAGDDRTEAPAPAARPDFAVIRGGA